MEEEEFRSLARERLKKASFRLDPAAEIALGEIIRFGVGELRDEAASVVQYNIITTLETTPQQSLERLVDEMVRVATERNAKSITPDIVVAALMLMFCGIWPFCRRTQGPGNEWTPTNAVV